MEYGKYNELEVIKKDRWFYELEGGVKLPFDACGDLEIIIGNKVNPFVYMDIEKGLMGTLGTVFGQVGELAYLHVVATSDMGAFLDLGIGKHVLLLKNKMEVEVKEGDDILVALKLDNKNRIAATMKISDYIEVRPSSKVGEDIRGIIYRINPEMGLFIAVDGKYHGFIHKSKLQKKYKVGDMVEAKIVKIRDDGKLELSFRDLAYKEMDKDASVIFEYMKDHHGVLDISEDSSPEKIMSIFKISKKSFKRAVGNLYRDKKIEKIDGIFKIVE